MVTVKIPLCCLRPGQKARVENLHLEESMRHRLEEMGLIPGTEIICLRHAPARSPGAYGFRGSVVALRKSDAEQVEVLLWD